MTDLAKAIEYEANWYAFCASVVGNISCNKALIKMGAVEPIKVTKRKKSKFTMDEEWYLEQTAKGLLHKDIAELLGCSRETVSKEARRLAHWKYKKGKSK